MTKSILSSWFFGTTLLLIVYLLWFLAIFVEKESEILMWLVRGAPIFAACLASYLYPRQIIILSISITISTVLIAVGANSLYQMFGHISDFSGLQGNLILASLTAIYGGIFSFIGSLIGSFLKKKST